MRSGPADPHEDSSGDSSLQDQQKDSPGEGGADPAAVSAISLSKTPIMRLRTKSEPKRIAVSLKSVDEIAEGLAAADERELGAELEPIEAPLGPMTPVEMFLHDSVKFGGGSFLYSPPSEQQRKSSVLNPTVVPAGLAQVECKDHFVLSFIVFCKSRCRNQYVKWLSIFLNYKQLQNPLTVPLCFGNKVFSGTS